MHKCKPKSDNSAFLGFGYIFIVYCTLSVGVIFMAVSKKDIYLAIETLEAQGIVATNAAILAMTGGSNATVQKYRKEYYDQRQAQIIKESIVLRDQEISVLTDAFSILLKQRIEALQHQYMIDTQQLTESLAQVSNELDDMHELVATTKQQLTELVDVNKKLTSNYELQEKRHVQDRQELQAQVQQLNELAYTHKGRAELLAERIKQYETKLVGGL